VRAATQDVLNPASDVTNDPSIGAGFEGSKIVASDMAAGMAYWKILKE